MKRVCTGPEMQAADRTWIDGLGLPGIALMETASRGVAERVRRHVPDGGRVVVVCGSGNNGGDGYGIARWLHGWGIPVSIVAVSEPVSDDAKTMAAIAERLNIPRSSALSQCDVLVDALLGTSISRPLTGKYLAMVEAINRSDAVVVSVDLPSGIHPDSGEILGVAVHATETVTLGLPKRGLYGGAWQRAGAIYTLDIGLGSRVASSAEALDAHDVAQRWPSRQPGDHKGRSGRVGIVAGSVSMAGAAILACRGALAAGSGLVTLLCTTGMLPRLGRLPEAVMVKLVGAGDRLETLTSEDVVGFDALVIGPGLGGGRPLSAQLHQDLQRLDGTLSAPTVCDADALVALAQHPGGPRVITPHPGEAARALQLTVPEVERDRFSAVEALAGPRVALLKGPRTLISDGERLRINLSGHQVLGTGGSGDVLAGVIGSLLGRGLDPMDAASLGAWIHGKAGESLAARRAVGWSAVDIAREVGVVLHSIGD